MRQSITLTCPKCKATFQKEMRQYNQSIKLGYTCHCSRKCSDQSRANKQQYNCTQCAKVFTRTIAQSKSKNLFCCHSCQAIYSNTHKTYGTRVSKLEKWLQSKLTKLYPNLQFIFNSSQEVGLELDIYIPELKLAFELNGIFHYEPIFGQDKLNRTQFNDNQKYQACIAKGISLCVIDTSTQKYVKPSTSQKFLDIITNLIDKHPLSESN